MNICKGNAKFSVKKFVFSVKAIIFAENRDTIAMDAQMIKTLQDYFATQPVLKAWVFGSFARGEETPESDIDLLVALDRSKPIGLRYFGMWGDLERLLGREVDFVEEGFLEPYAEVTANRDKKLIYERGS